MGLVGLVYSFDPANIIFFRWEELGPASMIQIKQLSNASVFQLIKWQFITIYNRTPFAGLQEYLNFSRTYVLTLVKLSLYCILIEYLF